MTIKDRSFNVAVTFANSVPNAKAYWGLHHLAALIADDAKLEKVQRTMFKLRSTNPDAQTMCELIELWEAL